MCRRHHRVKQLGWEKWRTADGIWWTGPTPVENTGGTERPIASLLLSEQAAEERWWARELAGLRRQAFATPHA